MEVLLETLVSKCHGHVRIQSMTYHLERLTMTYDRVWETYTPQHCDGKVLFFWSRHQLLGIRPDHLLGCDGLLTGEVQPHEVPGFGQNMLYEPNVWIIASGLTNMLESPGLRN